MKRILCLFLSIFMLFLAGCSANAVDSGQSGNSAAPAVGSSNLNSEDSSSVGNNVSTDASQDGDIDETPSQANGQVVMNPELSNATQNLDPSAGIVYSADGRFKVKELLNDKGFSDGFKVRSQKDHSNNDAWSDLGNFTYGKAVTPKWTLCQWDSGRCIWGSQVSSSNNTLTDGVSKWVTYNPTDKSLLLRLNTNDYYKGNGAREGDYWPHLLVEQNFAYPTASAEEKVFYTGAADKWNLSFDLRMPYYSFTNHGGWVNAAQLYIYLGAHHKPTGRFIWFGVQVFDSRWKNNSDTHYAVDGGKGDATGNMIYCVGMSSLYSGMTNSFWGASSPQVTNNYIHFEIDMIPHLQAMINRGISEQNLPSGTNIGDFYIDYMNYGWEIIGTYDCGVEIKNLSLKSYIDVSK